VQLALYGESNIDLEDDAHRNAYIEELFEGAAQRPPSPSSALPSTQPGEDEDGDYTGAAETTTMRSNQPGWPFWPWGGRGNSAQEEPPTQEQPTTEPPWG
jgi:hypothetical protein